MNREAFYGPGGLPTGLLYQWFRRPHPTTCAVGLDFTKTDPDLTDALTLPGSPPSGCDMGEATQSSEIIESDEITAVCEAPAFRRRSSDGSLTSETREHQRGGGLDARHARPNTEPPLEPMTVTEAETMICSLVREWIRQRVKAQGTQ